MSPFTPLSIKKLGLDKYLDNNYAKQGGYAEFVALLEAKANKSLMARRFGVSRPTMTKWVNVHNDAQMV